MRRLPRLVRALSLFVTVAAAGTASGGMLGDPSAVQACPEYGQHLERAQSALERGRKEVAIAALRDAQGALRRCEEETGDGGPLLGSSVPAQGTNRTT